MWFFILICEFARESRSSCFGPFNQHSKQICQDTWSNCKIGQHSSIFLESLTSVLNQNISFYCVNVFNLWGRLQLRKHRSTLAESFAHRRLVAPILILNSLSVRLASVKVFPWATRTVHNVLHKNMTPI